MAIVGENVPWRAYAGGEVPDDEDEDGSSVNCVCVRQSWTARRGIGITVPCVANRRGMQTVFFCFLGGMGVVRFVVDHQNWTVDRAPLRQRIRELSERSSPKALEAPLYM